MPPKGSSKLRQTRAKAEAASAEKVADKEDKKQTKRKRSNKKEKAKDEAKEKEKDDEATDVPDEEEEKEESEASEADNSELKTRKTKVKVKARRGGKKRRGVSVKAMGTMTTSIIDPEGMSTEHLALIKTQCATQILAVDAELENRAFSSALGMEVTPETRKGILKEDIEKYTEHMIQANHAIIRMKLRAREALELGLAHKKKREETEGILAANTTESKEESKRTADVEPGTKSPIKDKANTNRARTKNKARAPSKRVPAAKENDNDDEDSDDETPEAKARREAVIALGKEVQERNQRLRENTARMIKDQIQESDDIIKKGAIHVEKLSDEAKAAYMAVLEARVAKAKQSATAAANGTSKPKASPPPKKAAPADETPIKVDTVAAAAGGGELASAASQSDSDPFA